MWCPGDNRIARAVSWVAAVGRRCRPLKPVDRSGRVPYGTSHEVKCAQCVRCVVVGPVSGHIGVLCTVAACASAFWDPIHHGRARFVVHIWILGIGLRVPSLRMGQRCHASGAPLQCLSYLGLPLVRGPDAGLYCGRGSNKADGYFLLTIPQGSRLFVGHPSALRSMGASLELSASRSSLLVSGGALEV